MYACWNDCAVIPAESAACWLLKDQCSLKIFSYDVPAAHAAQADMHERACTAAAAPNSVHLRPVTGL